MTGPVDMLQSTVNDWPSLTCICDTLRSPSQLPSQVGSGSLHHCSGGSVGAEYDSACTTPASTPTTIAPAEATTSSHDANTDPRVPLMAGESLAGVRPTSDRIRSVRHA